MRRYVFIGLLTLVWSAVQAQPSSGGPEPGATDPAAVPIDGGASLLLLSGAAYGWRRLRKGRQPA